MSQGRIYNYSDKLRLCLFAELGIRQLYESYHSRLCDQLTFTRAELNGEEWVIICCKREAKTRRRKVAGQMFNVCNHTCKKRNAPIISEFFGKMNKRIRFWKDVLIDDELGRLEARQHQRPVGDCIVTL